MLSFARGYSQAGTPAAQIDIEPELLIHVEQTGAGVLIAFALSPFPELCCQLAIVRNRALSVTPRQRWAARNDSNTRTGGSFRMAIATETVKALKYPAMRSLLIAILGLLFFSGIGTCADSDAREPAHPDLIIVRRFAAPARAVALDPSLGFSLHRSQPSVSAARRAASVARATAFILADTITQQLRGLGYDAVQSDEAGPEPDGRALIVSGALRSINEGHRRHLAARDASVAASVEIEHQTHGATPQRLINFQLDSRETLRQSWTHHESGVNSATMRLGVRVAHAVAELAQRDNWPKAPP